MGKTGKSVRTRSWSALQLVPQGVDGATLTLVFEHDHAALLSLSFGLEPSIAKPAAKINSLPV